jgi:hypothetical protein
MEGKSGRGARRIRSTGSCKIHYEFQSASPLAFISRLDWKINFGPSRRLYGETQHVCNNHWQQFGRRHRTYKRVQHATHGGHVFGFIVLLEIEKKRRNITKAYSCSEEISFSEQLFSKAGELISARRNRLGRANVDMLHFLNKKL